MFTDSRNQHYHCFGCQASGDVFSFVRQIEGMNFPSALKLLADRAGIRLEKDKRDRALLERQRVHAAEIGPEAHAYWTAVRQQYIRLENEAFESIRRAERWLEGKISAGIDTATPAGEYAWFWLQNGETIAAAWREQIDMIDSAEPRNMIIVYEQAAMERPRLRRQVRARMAATADFAQALAGIIAEAA